MDERLCLSDLELFANVNDWAGYNFIPTYWSFLVTGNQYSDSLRLARNKLHVALHAGISGFSYSTRGGWRFPFTTTLTWKRLFTDAVFAGGHFQYVAEDIGESNGYSFGSGARLGWQMNGRTSLVLSYENAKYLLREYYSYRRYGLEYSDLDENNEFMLKLDNYFGRKHILSPEIGYGYKNLGFGRNRYFKAGLGYAFVFK